jgi:hypothetical protein
MKRIAILASGDVLHGYPTFLSRLTEPVESTHERTDT